MSDPVDWTGVREIHARRDVLKTIGEEAERLVQVRCEHWGWGTFKEFDGLAEHGLAVKACMTGIQHGRMTGPSQGSEERKAIVEFLRNGGQQLGDAWYSWDSEMRSYADSFASMIEGKAHL